MIQASQSWENLKQAIKLSNKGHAEESLKFILLNCEGDDRLTELLVDVITITPAFISSNLNSVYRALNQLSDHKFDDFRSDLRFELIKSTFEEICKNN